jgi:hypothetical protein
VVFIVKPNGFDYFQIKRGEEVRMGRVRFIEQIKSGDNRVGLILFGNFCPYSDGAVASVFFLPNEFFLRIAGE